MLSRLHPELAAELDPTRALSKRESLVAHLLGSALTRPIATPLVMAFVLAAGKFRAWRLELALTRVLRLIELSSAFRKASKSPFS